MCTLRPTKTPHRTPLGLRDDRQLRAGDLLHIGLQIVRREPHRALRILGDDDLGARLAVLDEESVGGVEDDGLREQHRGNGQEDFFHGKTRGQFSGVH